MKRLFLGGKVWPRAVAVAVLLIFGGAGVSPAAPSVRGEAVDEIDGTVELLPETANFIGDWKVDDYIVHVTSATAIEQEDTDSPLVVGADVEVTGTLNADGTVTAERVFIVNQQRGRNQTTGTIKGLPNNTSFIGEWIVTTAAGDQTVKVTTRTRIKQKGGQPAIGKTIVITGKTRNNAIEAKKVEVNRRDS